MNSAIGCGLAPTISSCNGKGQKKDWHFRKVSRLQKWTDLGKSTHLGCQVKTKADEHRIEHARRQENRSSSKD